MTKPRILAVSASLRNARWGKGVGELLDTIREKKDRDELFDFIRDQARIHFQQFIDAGREKGLPFDQMYENLKRQTGDKGLCNSEIGMAVALWAAWNTGCDIDYIPLSSHFNPTGGIRNAEALREKLLLADGLLLCTPVYFGDRSSLASDFIEFVRADEEIRRYLVGKPVAGVAVGAKRNGGQETTLIYQLMEMTDLGMLGLGNDSDTTSQYGGTIRGGDVGTAADDEYGLNTAIGTGRRVGQVSYELSRSHSKDLSGPLRVMFWILQDAEGKAERLVWELIGSSRVDIAPKVMKLTEGKVSRCIACDICPTHIGADIEYRCIIKRSSDEFVSIHKELLDYDVIVPVAYSPRDRSKLTTVYQRFIERTRYLRRGDYLFTDVAIIPLVLEELGVTEHLHIRMLTSMIRHHTVILKPDVCYLNDGQRLNWDSVVETWNANLEHARRITIGRLVAYQDGNEAVSYHPVGYVLSAAADRELSVEERRRVLHEDREQRRAKDAEQRLL